LHIFAVMKFPKKLLNKLNVRKENNAFRTLGNVVSKVDFFSNDYLGFSKSDFLFRKVHAYLEAKDIKENGATGSRLISGNSLLHSVVETKIKECHNSEAAILFNSGYDANLGFFEAVPQRGDIILYDEYIHASIRDGIRLSNAKSYKFKHNNLAHLDEILKRVQYDNVYIVTESVFSMDGDSPDLLAMTQISKAYNALLVVDEAHAIGVFGASGAGLIQELKLESEIFAHVMEQLFWEV